MESLHITRDMESHSAARESIYSLYSLIGYHGRKKRATDTLNCIFLPGVLTLVTTLINLDA